MDFENGNVSMSVSHGTLLAKIKGEIDHHTARGIRDAIDSTLCANSPDHLIIDLSQVTFMDSSGLGLVLGRYTKATEAGISFRVCGAGERIITMFDMAGLDRIIDYKEKNNEN